MNILWTLTFFLIALAVLIVVHEFGHFWVARKCGVKVLRFAVGFGKPIYSKRFGADDTEFVVCALPLGGYVKMLDEREGEVAQADLPRSFNRQTVGKRFAIVAAGPIANFLLALAVYWVVFMAGVDELKPVVDAPLADSPAAVAGFSRGDRVVRVGDQQVATWQAFRLQILEVALGGNRASVVVVSPNGAEREVSLDLSSVDRDHLDRDFLSALGLVPERMPLPPVVGGVESGGAADKAGLREGDLIEQLADRRITHWAELVETVRAHPGQVIALHYTRDGSRIETTVAVAEVEAGGKKIGRIGLSPKPAKGPSKNLVTVHYNPLDAAVQSAVMTWDTTRLSLSVMWKMVWGEVSWRNLSGPVAIADYAGRSAAMGPSTYIKFIALVSISLGIVNLLPIPMLDGGHLMYYLAEIIKGSPVSERVMELGQKIGIALLFMLMSFALYNDIHRLLGFSG
jgi:regulator of sigma E protease